MFHVQLLVTNTSAVDYIEDCTAELKLPEGLSLAALVSGMAQQELTIDIGTVAEGEGFEANWYIRGDKEGEYNLTALVSGTYMPNPEPFTVAFTTEKPFKVWAGSAMKLVISAERSAKKGQYYRVEYMLENVSLNIFGGRFVDEYTAEDLQYDPNGENQPVLQGSWNNGYILTDEAFEPGEKMSGVFKILFDDEIIEEDVRYLLTDMFNSTMDGSTTEIPSTFEFIDHTDTAIVVVPGIMVSELYAAESGRKVWLPDTVTGYANALGKEGTATMISAIVQDLVYAAIADAYGDEEASHYFGNLYDSAVYALDELHVEDNGTIRYDNITVAAPSSSEYGTQLCAEDMVKAMLTYSSDTYLFSYDWRNDNAVSAKNLNAFISQLQQDHERVIIIAHSMGGLVTSSYVDQFGDDDVDLIVTCGTPYYGTPKGTYMLDMMDGIEEVIGEYATAAVAKIMAKVELAIATSGVSLAESKLTDFLLKQIITEGLAEINKFGLSLSNTDEDIEELVWLLLCKLEIGTLTQYYRGFYQLIPSTAYGGYILGAQRRVIGHEAEMQLVYGLLEQTHASYAGAHREMVQQAYAFHEGLGESLFTSSNYQPLLRSQKAYFIVGENQRTISYLEVDKDEANDFVDVQVEGGDGTVTSRSATMCGSLPSERTLYISCNHGQTVACNTSINAVKDLLYGDNSGFAAEDSWEHNALDKDYIKIKAECPVDINISNGSELLTSSVLFLPDGSYSFTMPSGRVSIRVTYRASGLPFLDVGVDDWFYNDVAYVYHNHLMNGTTAVTFEPYKATTRGMLVTILWRMAGCPIVNAPMYFTDVAADQYYVEAIRWAYTEGIVTGYSDTEFRPDADITREQFASILYRFMQYRGLDTAARQNALDAFLDRDSVSDYAVPAMRWAVEQGLISGSGDGYLNPGGAALRSHSAAILHRLCSALLE